MKVTHLHLVLVGLDRGNLIGLLKQGSLDVVDLGGEAGDVIADGRGHELQTLHLFLHLETVFKFFYIFVRQTF